MIDGKCDLGGTFAAAYTSAKKTGINAAKARVFTVTGRTPHDSIVSGPDVSAELKTKMRDALIDFDPQTEAGVSHLGDVEELSGFAEVSDDVYDAVREALDAARRAELSD